uniref:ZP domain-containing protein n=1 Tax=Cyclopterus lumpus TaxID=8103 RepID=A0A8C3AT36_CYCLU
MLVFIFPPDGTQHIVLTPNLAAQCGYSMESDPWGNTRIYSSLLGCYVDNQVSHGIWKLTFYTPEPVSMVLREAEQVGYAAMATSTRLVMRSPYNTAETTSEEVDGVSMEVFRVSAYYKAPHGLGVENLAAACPTGGVLFINNVISWHVPRRMTPLVDGSFEIREMHMGINGRRLDRSQMAARGYTLSATDFHIIIEIPVGSPDGHYKSHAPDYQYHISYIVEPMLEVLWRTTVAHDDTRYKVLFPITTPLIPQALHVQEKLPTITGSCDQNQFYISVKYGSQGNNFKAMVGHQQLTPEMADYQFQENSTHFSLILPYTAKDTTFEVYSLRARVDFFLLHTSNDWVLADLFLSCNFPLTTTKCYPNGTMTATAVKVDSVTDIIPSRLTLKDQSCKPAFSGDRIAYFLFNVASCGTTRTFFDHYMLYENEIALPYNKGASPVGPQQTISCYYVVNETQIVGFGANPRLYEPTAEIGSGQLMVQMRLAQDSSYTLFYQAEDYPVVKYLRQSLYFEVELVESTDPNLELILESCWATLDEDRTSLPSWDIIVDSCENPDDSYVTIFHPVVSDARVLVPSHIKRFSMKMFTFTKDKEVLKDEVKYELCLVIAVFFVFLVQRGTDSINQRQISSGPIVLTSGQTSE